MILQLQVSLLCLYYLYKIISINELIWYTIISMFFILLMFIITYQCFIKIEGNCNDDICLEWICTNVLNMFII